MCGINKEINRIPGEKRSIACVYVCMYYVCTCVYVCVRSVYVCIYACIYVCMSLYKRINRLYYKMIGDRIKLPAVKYI